MVSSRESLEGTAPRRAASSDDTRSLAKATRSRFSPFMEKEQERRHVRGTVKVPSRWGSLYLTTEIYRLPFAFSSCPSFLRSLSPSISTDSAFLRGIRVRPQNCTQRLNELTNGSLEHGAWNRRTLGDLSAPFDAFRFRACRARKRDVRYFDNLIPPGIRSNFDG